MNDNIAQIDAIRSNANAVSARGGCAQWVADGENERPYRFNANAPGDVLYAVDGNDNVWRLELPSLPDASAPPRSGESVGNSSVASLKRELAHLVRLLEPLEQAGTLNVPGLATLNGARAALANAT